MKNIILLASAFFAINAAFSQSGPFLPDTNALEGIIVEKYYKSGTDDIAAGLPEGAITYRVFADLKPDYTVLNYIAFSVHPMSIRVTGDGEFYNNGLGGIFGANINPLLFTVDASVALDSWLTIGGAHQGGLGVLKEDDTDDSSVLANSPLGYLFNDEGYCLPTLQEQDGIAEGATPEITSLGLDADQLSIFGTSNSSDDFFVNDITIAVLGGFNMDNEENKVLIGQFTTINGTLEFDLNLQVGIPEELQCNVTPACQKNSIWYTYSFDPQDTQNNTNPDLNYVTYQNESLSYVDDGEPCNLVGVDDQVLLDNAFSASPNPTRENVELSFSKTMANTTCEVYNASGQLVKRLSLGTIAAGTSIPLDLRAFESGIYIVKISSEDRYGVKKIVKY